MAAIPAVQSNQATPAKSDVANDFKEIGDIFNLSTEDFFSGNRELLATMLKFNLLWSAIFLCSIWMLWDTLQHYVPFVRRVPFVPTIMSMVWFTSNLLLTIIIYGTSNNTAVRVAGFLFILLLLISVVLALWRIGSSVAILLAHRSFAIACYGPTAISINGMLFSSDFVPSAVVISNCGGVCTFQGSNLGALDVSSAVVKVYSGSAVCAYTLGRNGIKNREANIMGKSCTFSVFTPDDTKSV